MDHYDCGQFDLEYPATVTFYQTTYTMWHYSYLPTPPLGQDMTQGQFLNEV